MNEGVVFTNVDVIFKSIPECKKCGGKGYLRPTSMGYSSSSVTQCPACCEHNGGTYNRDGVKTCNLCGESV